MLQVAVLALGAIFLVALLAAAITSVGEREARAAALLWLSAVVVPAPFLFIGFAGGPSQPYLAAALLAATGLGGLFFLIPGPAPAVPDDTPQARIDERDIMFSRMLLKPGTDRYSDYYRANPDKKVPDDVWRAKPGLLKKGSTAYHPIAFPAANASFTTIEHLRPFVDGEPAAERVDVDPSTITRFIDHWVLKLGAISVGVTELRDYHVYTTVGRGPDYGRPVTLDHDFAIALTVEMDKEMLSHAPLSPTVMESAQQYVESGVIAVQVAEFIRGLGYPARAHIDGNYRVVCPLVARDAGLGEIGRMGLLMTPELGPRVRIAVVTTDLPLIPSESRRDPTTIDFCAQCRKCADVCPSDAISAQDQVDIAGVRRWQIDSEACFTLWSGTGTDCARCMAACPYSHPDNWMHNLVRWGVKSSGRLRKMAIIGDDVLYGRRPAPRDLPEWLGD